MNPELENKTVVITGSKILHVDGGGVHHGRVCAAATTHLKATHQHNKP